MQMVARIRKSWPDLTSEILRSVADYDPTTGTFTAAQTKRSKRHGRVMGWSDKDGYIHIRVKYKLYLAHRLAWLYVYGKWPSGNLDHINGDPADNRISNLRECDQRQNLANSVVVYKNSSIRKGVSFDNAKRLFRAYIVVGRKQIFLGRFPTVEEAIAARLEAEKQYHGEFARAA